MRWLSLALMPQGQSVLGEKPARCIMGGSWLSRFKWRFSVNEGYALQTCQHSERLADACNSSGSTVVMLLVACTVVV